MRIDKTPTCWLWKGPVASNGYGKFWYASVTVLAHRFAYAMAHGPIPPGMHVCHRCDVTCCVNPDHLFIGTAADNVRDKMQKGRGPTGERNGARKHPERRAHGEGQGLAKLTDAKVRAIREQHTAGLSYAAIGRRFGVTGACVCLAVRRKTWKHVA